MIGSVLCLSVGIVGGDYAKTAVHAIYSGTSKTEHNQNLEYIAVVNLDAGIEKNGEQIYYAGKIIEYPNANYKTTSLEEAKKGIESGQYGAYIIIPATFSASVESINQTPQKCVFEYEISKHLEGKEKEDMIYEIVDFEKDTSSNLSYIFVDAILKEVHSVQDGAGTVMGNDNYEKEALLGVQAEALLEPIEFTELTENNEIVQPIDLTAQNEELNRSVQKIQKDFDSALDKGQNDYRKTVENNKDLTKSLTALEKSLEVTNPLQDEAGNYNLTEGIKEVNLVLDEKNAKIAGQREELEKNILEEMELYKTRQTSNLSDQRNRIQTELVQDALKTMQGAVDRDLAEINRNMQDSLSQQNQDLQSEIDLYQQDVKDITTKKLNAYQKAQITYYNQSVEESNQKIEELQTLVEEIEDAESDLVRKKKIKDLQKEIEKLQKRDTLEMPEEFEEIADEETEDYIGDLQKDLLCLSQNLDIENARKEDGTLLTLPQAGISLANAAITLSASDITYAVPELSVTSPTVSEDKLQKIETLYKISKDGLEDAVQKNIVDVILKRNEDIQNRVLADTRDFSDKQQTYQSELDSFDPYSYMDYGDISEQLAKVSENVSSIQSDMNEKNQIYLNYTADVYELANEHTRILQEDLLRANEKTGQNIVNQVETLKSSRTDKNKSNIGILIGITKKLKYTRMGDLPYREVYDFIVNPLEYQRKDK